MNDDKTWLIEAGDVLEVMTPDRKPTQPAPRPRAEVKIGNIPPAPASQRPALAATGVPIRPLTAVATPGEPAPRRKKPAPPAKGKLQFAPLALLTYVLGPLALFLTPRGRRQKGWVAVAGLAVGATALLAGLGFDGIVDASRPATVWAWLGLVVLAVAGGFTAWARALHLIGAEGIPSVNKLPWWVRRAWTVSGLGLVAPGSGLLMSGRAGRAALVLWGAWPVVAAAVLLRNGLSLWRHHETAGWLADHGVLLERGLIAVAAVVALGFLGYVAQALEGVRQVMVEPGLKTRVKGDYYAVAVMAFALALVVVANPAQLARQIDTGGHILREEGFRAIPLELSLLSARLDPARVEYALQAMDLYSELGAHEQADAMRAQLDDLRRRLRTDRHGHRDAAQDDRHDRA